MTDRFPQTRELQILAVLGRGFEEMGLTPYTGLAGWTRLIPTMPAVQVLITGYHEVIPSRHGLRVVRDLDLHTAAERHWDAVLIPGGWPDAGYEELYQEPVLSILRRTQRSMAVSSPLVVPASLLSERPAC